MGMKAALDVWVECTGEKATTASPDLRRFVGLLTSMDEALRLVAWKGRLA